MTAERRFEPWGHVHLLGVIAQLGSLTLAAQRLGLSKAAVSQRLAELERAAGVPLALRTTRSLRLTDAGQQLVDDTVGAFADIDHSLARVRDLGGQPRGRVRVTAPVALGRQHLAPALQSFFAAWPEVRVDLELSDQVVNLAREGQDLAIRHTSAPPDSQIAWKLCASRTLLVASAAYLARKGLPGHPSELATHDCLAYLRPGPSVWRLERAQPAGRTRQPGGPERVSVSVHGPLRANNSEVLRDAVAAGLGIAQVPDFSVVGALRAGTLREVLPGWAPVGFFGDAIYAIRPWSPSTPRPVQLVVEHLRAAFAAGFLA